ncbi:MAG: tRNA (N(6)-L-threonylcarbamoyladenosine(37)-C(2))-methylthiotransferase MtaB [Clostridiales bacterium]|nr:tRNA (N(6)-L-threonylcarbamoyladenosine(37)-C(2))-methylthiotransferase MtaB [Clostridiales bacterium]
MRKVAALTLGCKVNLYDTEAILSKFREAGWEVTESGRADAVVVNTCAVTNVSDRKSRQAIRRAAERNPGAAILAAGCWARLRPDEAAAIPGVTAVVRDDADLTRFIGSAFGSTPEAALGFAPETALGSAPETALGFAPETALGFAPETARIRPAFSGRTRAFVKIQDGCDNYCAYCVVPYARGPSRSRGAAEIAAEIRAMAAAGFKEVVLTGIHAASYGKDLDGQLGLIDIIELACAEDGIERVRLSSLEPGYIDDGFVRRASRLGKLCPHFHLSLQSGCDATLARMGRRYTSARYLESAGLLLSAFPSAALTTDIIVGFPGETGRDFADSADFVRRAGLARIHVFPYSAKAGTRAASMPDQAPSGVKAERAAVMRAISGELWRGFLSRSVGRSAGLLAEQEVSPGVWEGLTPNYIPVRAAWPGARRGDTARVTITGSDGAVAFAEKIV